MRTNVHECREQIRVHIRWLIKRDMPEVLANEEACFSWDAWSEEEFLRVLRNRNHIGMVAEQGEKVIGHMVYVLSGDSDNREGEGFLHIINFCVSPEHQRRGVGSQMLQKLKSKIEDSCRRNRLLIDVREGNTSCHLFLKRQEFKCEEVLRAEHPEDEDLYRFVWRCPRKQDLACEGA